MSKLSELIEIASLLSKRPIKQTEREAVGDIAPGAEESEPSLADTSGGAQGGFSKNANKQSKAEG
jgi:hypothetical protein